MKSIYGLFLILLFASPYSIAKKIDHQVYQETINTYVSAWTEDNKSARNKIINKTTSRAIRIHTPDISRTKRSGILKEIEEFQANFESVKVNYAPAKFSGRHAHFSWSIEDSAGKHLTSGYTSLIFDKKGRIINISNFY